MHTQKVAVTIPKDLVALIDEISKNEGLSRSKYISSVLREKLESEKNRYIKDRFFADKRLGTKGNDRQSFQSQNA